jgi:heptaprenyl diphosphate synthase
MALVAVALGSLEGMLPRPVPFLKLGLANVAVVYALVRTGAAGAAMVTGLRVAGAGLVTGTLATPTFALSVSGALLSLLVMAPLALLRPRMVSVVGISAAGGAASMAGQLAAALAVLPDIPLSALAGPALAWGCLSGAAVGVAANWLLRRGRLSKIVDHLAQGGA